MVIKTSKDRCWARVYIEMFLIGKTISVVTPVSRTQITVTSKKSVFNKMSEFLRFSVDTGQVLAVVSGYVLLCNLYEAGGAEIARGSRGLITSLANGETVPKEVAQFDYHYDISWTDQRKALTGVSEQKFRVVLPSDMPFLIFEPGTCLIFNILSTSTIPAIPHRNSNFLYDIRLFNGSYSRYRELKAKGCLRNPNTVIRHHKFEADCMTWDGI